MAVISCVTQFLCFYRVGSGLWHEILWVQVSRQRLPVLSRLQWARRRRHSEADELRREAEEGEEERHSEGQARRVEEEE